MILTQARLAEAMDVAKSDFLIRLDAWPEEAKAAGFLMLSYMLQAMGLKEPQESLKIATDRMKALGNTFDLLNADHRNIMAGILRQMYQPLGVQEIVILGVTESGKCFLTGLYEESMVPRTDDQIKELLRAIAESEDTEGLTL